MGTKQDFSGLKVGDGIWCTRARIRSSEVERPLMQLVVTKVGRKYLTTQEVDARWPTDYMFEIATGVEKVDTNYKSKLVLSPYQYEADKRRDAVWREFHNYIHNLYSNHDVEEQDIRAAAKLLNIELS